MPTEPPHILIIDDNEDILFMLQTMLKVNGYQTSIKKNTANIYSNIEALSPDVIIMDMLLSGADGREICKHLKATEAFSAIPVIMISAHPNAKQSCLDAGANYFIAKPFDMKEILQAAKTALH